MTIVTGTAMAAARRQLNTTAKIRLVDMFVFVRTNVVPVWPTAWYWYISEGEYFCATILNEESDF